MIFQEEWKLADRVAQMSHVHLTEGDIPIPDASRTVLKENLTKVWGKKMKPDSSKTAITVRWVLASISDFNGQLQARDIVRFLKYASMNSGVERTQYLDRFLMPEDMRRAVKECLDEKLKEV